MTRGVAWGVAGNVTYALCQWAMLAVVARVGGPVMVGKFALGLALTAPVIMGTNLQLATLLATGGGDAPRFRDYLSLRLGSSVVAAGVIALVGSLVAPADATVIVLLIGASKLVESVSDIHYGLFQRLQRLDVMAKSQLLRGVGALIVFAITLVITRNLDVAVTGLLIAWLTALLAFDMPSGRTLLRLTDATAATPPADRSAYRQHLIRLGLPLGCGALLVSLGSSVPRLLVQDRLGTAALGVFAALAFFLVGGRMVAIPLASVMAPRLGSHASAGDLPAFRADLRHLIGLGVALGLAGLIAAAVGGRLLLRVAYGAEFANHVLELTMLMAAAALGYVAYYLQVAATALRSTKAQLLIIAAGVLVTAGCTRVFVPHYGLMGACLAVVVGALVELVGSAILVQWALRRPPLPHAAVTGSTTS